jgi:2-iminobutanoate/2-iminopropanoate deaminase
MDERVPITTDKAPRAIGPYSQAIRCGGLLFTSGQVALDPTTGEMLQGTVEDEVARVLDSLEALLRAGGSGLDQVVKTTVFLTDLKDFEAMNAVYARYFGAAKPARSTVQVAALPRRARVEIEAIARVS